MGWGWDSRGLCHSATVVAAEALCPSPLDGATKKSFIEFHAAKLAGSFLAEAETPSPGQPVRELLYHLIVVWLGSALFAA